MGLNFSTLQHTRLTDAFQMLTFDFTAYEHDDKPSSFLNLSSSVEVKAVNNGCPTAVVYWFDLVLTEGVIVSTIDARYHWRQAAKLLESSLYITSNDLLMVHVECKNSYFSLSLEMSK